MTDRDLMQLALYALGLAKSSHNMVLSSDPPQSAWRYYDVDMKLRETITALDDRLAQPEQEPVAYRYKMPVEDDHWVYNFCQFPDNKSNPNLEPLYTIPPQRPWVGLTNEQIINCTHHMAKENNVWIVTDNGLLEFAHILEETIRSKNK
jgi:hypothetical protein